MPLPLAALRVQLVSVSHGPPSEDSTARHARHANQAPQSKLHKSRKSPPSHAVSVAPDDDVGGGGAVWIQEARNTTLSQMSFSVAGGCVQVSVSPRKEARQGRATWVGRARQFRVFRFDGAGEAGRGPGRPPGEHSIQNTLFGKVPWHEVAFREPRVLDAGACNFPSKPLASHQTVLRGFWLPSGRQSNLGRPSRGSFFTCGPRVHGPTTEDLPVFWW